MSTKITPGKLAGLKAVSNERGTIAATAMDQRGSLKKALAKEKGGDVSDAMMEEFKGLVAEVLTPHASAILLDPEWGLGASKKRSKNAGLLLAYEQSGYDNTRPGRLPDLLHHWSVRRLKEAGANCVKVLIYYTPFDTKAVNEEKHALRRADRRRVPHQRPPLLLGVCGLRSPRAATKKGPSSRRRNPRSSGPAWLSSLKIGTAWT